MQIQSEKRDAIESFVVVVDVFPKGPQDHQSCELITEHEIETERH